MIASQDLTGELAFYTYLNAGRNFFHGMSQQRRVHT